MVEGGVARGRVLSKQVESGIFSITYKFRIVSSIDKEACKKFDSFIQGTFILARTWLVQCGIMGVGVLWK